MQLPASRIGTALALAAALLFGVTAPLAKLWLTGIPAIQASGLLYTSAGCALGVWRVLRQGRDAHREAPLARADWPPLLGAIFFGGLLGPTLLLFGLARVSGTAASLLLNLEAVFTVLLALAFGESLGRRVGLGIGAIILGGVVLGVDPAMPGTASVAGAIAIAGACASWGMDNNLTQKLSGRDPTAVVALKGLVAGPIALVIAWLMGASLPSPGTLLAAAVLGATGYGLSLLCFVLALRHIGTARTGSLFAAAPFAGALAAMAILHEPLTASVLVAGAAMAGGVALMLGEHHAHEHTHAAIAHEHAHVHDAHHQHAHEGWEGPEPHSHPHVHAPLTHTHPHAPDLHHRHQHED